MANSALTQSSIVGDIAASDVEYAGGTVEEALQGLGAGIAPGTIYVATTGNDTTGDGSSGSPYLTVGRALEDVPRILESEVVIDVANGTYAEALTFEAFVCTGAGSIRVTGDTTTPENVTFTGTVTRTGVMGDETACVFVSGPVVVELEGIRINATADHGVAVVRRGVCHIDRCTITGTLDRGILGYQFATIFLHGDITISGWSSYGMDLIHKVDARYFTPGTLTVTGPGTTGVGIDIFNHSSLRCRNSDVAGGMNLTITGVLEGFHVSLCSLFQNLQGSSTITIDNASKPADSVAVMSTDHSSWSTTEAVVIDNFTYAFRCNSICYQEAVGSRTITNVTDTDDATQNSVIYLP